MIDTNALRGLIVQRGLSQKDVARSLKVSPKTFYDKMKAGKFGTDEAEKMIQILGIDDPVKIFFASNVTLKVTK